MMLYVANMTKQTHDFVYVIPAVEKHRTRLQTIPIGGQIRVHNDAPLPVLKAIIQQHEPYGMIPVEEARRTKGFIGLCYSIDRPIDLDHFFEAHEHNDDVLVMAGHEHRKASAIALSDSIDRRVGASALNGLEMEVIEEGKRGEERPNAVSEVIEVARPGRPRITRK